MCQGREVCYSWYQGSMDDILIISLYSHMQGHWPIIMKNIHKLHAFKVISANLIYTNT